jgi:hypothetical protein
MTSGVSFEVLMKIDFTMISSQRLPPPDSGTSHFWLLSWSCFSEMGISSTGE